MEAIDAFRRADLFPSCRDKKHEACPEHYVANGETELCYCPCHRTLEGA